MLTIKWDDDSQMFKWSAWVGEELVYGYALTKTRCEAAYREVVNPRRPLTTPADVLPAETPRAGLWERVKTAHAILTLYTNRWVRRRRA
jgi:hypothetical protein